MASKSGKKAAEATVDERAREAVLGFFWRKCRACVIAAVILIAIVGAMVSTESLWRPVVASWSAPLEIIEVAAATDEPRTFDVVARNALQQPAVVTGVEVEVKQVTPSRETIAGSSSLPVTEQFDAVLTPRAGSISQVSRPPFQVAANSVERFQMRLGTEAAGRSARVEYQLVLRFHVNQNDVVESTPFTARLSVR
jgi:hypothetical protein